MKTGMVCLTGMVLLAALFAACAAPSPEIRLDENDKHLELKTGQVFTTALEGNLTTGYTWEPVGMDEKLLARVGEAQYKPDSQAVGAGGVISLRFKALARGSTTLRLVYHRPWEKDQPPLKTVEFTLTIK